jgi:hypothetical protein
MLFLNPDSKFKTAAQTSKYLLLSQFHIHRLKKGSGTHAALGTTFPPHSPQLLLVASGAWARFWTYILGLQLAEITTLASY